MQGDQLLFTVLAVAIGLLACFWGYNLFRLVLSVGGFLLGAILLGTAAANNGASDGMALAATLLGGVVGLVIVNLAYYFGVFWIGVGWGASLTSVLLGWLEMPDTLIATALLIVGGVVGGVLAIMMHDAMIIVTTAMFGAAGFVLGVGALIEQDFDVLLQPSQSNLDDQRYLLMFVAWVLLTLGGLVYQMRRLRHDDGLLT